VLVTTRATGTEYAPSTLQAKLSAGETITFSSFMTTDDSLQITVNSINFRYSPGKG
jgi:hypothetical protein